MIKKLFLFALTLMPILSQSQFSNSLAEMKSDTQQDFAKYEQLLFDATEYIFNNPVNFKSKEFLSACQIVDFWKNKDTGINVPIFGSFYDSMNPKGNQRYFYMIAIMNYILGEKINHNRVLKNVRTEGQKYSEQEDVRESQIEGARIFLDYTSNEKNNLSLNPKSLKFLKAHKKGRLDKIFFD